MKFTQYQLLKEHTLAACAADGVSFPPAKQVNPILQAYIGGAVFSLYIRLRLLPLSSHVRVVNDLSMKMVSAVCQCLAMQELQNMLSAEEEAVFHRGRNAKSMVPKSASVREYRMATAFEALLGYLFLEEKEERLQELMDASFVIITKHLQECKK